MNATLLDDFWAAFEFLTRIPVPSHRHDENTLSRSSKFFPLVGLVIGLLAAALYKLLLVLHLNAPERAIAVLCLLVLITGAFHEDGLADTADGLGGGWTRERILEIMRDSRIGSYGGTALVLSLLTRYVCLSELHPADFWRFMIGAHVLCRWSTLPLSFALPAARPASGMGAQVAQKVTRSSLIAGTALTLMVILPVLKFESWAPLLAAAVLTTLSGLYYKKRLGGVTGDCFGATNQLVEIAVYASTLVLKQN